MTQRRGGLPTWESVHGRVRGRCRECGAKVNPPRRSWCSDACVQAHALRTDPNAQRLAVFARDHGVCSSCGRDCVKLRGDLEPLLSWHGAAVTLVGIVQGLGRLPDWWREKNGHDRADKIERAVALVLDLGLLKQIGGRHSFWDMDHKQPLWYGGTNELSNLVTLCIPCHRGKTGSGATQRASQRRKA